MDSRDVVIALVVERNFCGKIRAICHLNLPRDSIKIPFFRKHQQVRLKAFQGENTLEMEFFFGF